MFLPNPSLPVHLLLFLLLIATTHIVSARYVMYLTGQHPIVPSPDLVADITHVSLAFMRPCLFNVPTDDNTTATTTTAPAAAADEKWPLFTTVEKVRSQFAAGTKVMIAIGGWGDTEGFSEAAGSEEGMERFARNVRAMLDFTGADGVDIDWEYPGGNGEDYKTIPNDLKAWEIRAYPRLLRAIRRALSPHLLISAAVPGLPRDMLAFTATTIPEIIPSLSFLNVMTYDLMNRRDNVTKHHTGVQASLTAVDAYIAAGVPAHMINLGFAFYVKWFMTDHDSCSSNTTTTTSSSSSPIHCATLPLEDPLTGADLGRAGSFSHHDAIPSFPAYLGASWARALVLGMYDADDGGHYYLDEEADLWWTWDTEDAIARKVPKVVGERELGGVFAWGLGEDASEWRHLRALSGAWRAVGRGNESESESESESGENVAAAGGEDDDDGAAKAEVKTEVKATATATSNRGREEL